MSTSDDTRFDQQALVFMSRHLLYEIVTMRKCADLMVKQLPASELLNEKYIDEFAQTIKNAILESFLIHVRNLYDFLFHEPKKGKQNEDIVAAHYFPTLQDWKILREPFSPDYLYSLQEPINKHLAHFTRRRIEGLDAIRLSLFGWEFSQIRDQLDEALKLFLENVPEENVISELKTLD